MQAVPIDRITPTLYNDAGQVKGNGNALEGRNEEPIVQLGPAVNHG